MKRIVVPILFGLLSGTALAGQPATSPANPAPRGYVTIQEIPTVNVVAQRWNAADEAALHQSKPRAVAAVARTEKPAGFLHRLLAFASR